MVEIRQICACLELLAPARLAEEWDNIGLLVGDAGREARRVMTCLTVTQESAHEAIEEGADLIVTHHPMPFRPLQRMTTDTTVGRLLWDLIGARISVYSPHTCWDSAEEGINQQWARGLGLDDIQPLEVADPQFGSEGKGRWGCLPQPIRLSVLAEQVCRFLSIPGLHCVGDRSREIQRVAVACGSAGEFLAAAHRCGCDLLITGETNFHTSLEAVAQGMALILPGHYASERFAVETLADQLQERFPTIHVWPSRMEEDPLRWVSRAAPA